MHHRHHAEQNLELAQQQESTTFKLLGTISTTMHLFDRMGLQEVLPRPGRSCRSFAARLEFYQRRKDAMLADEEEQMRRLDNKVRFILMVVEGELVISNRKKADIEQDLDALGFDRLKKSAKRGKGSSQNDEDDDLEEGGSSKSKQPAGQKVSYDYLLSMPLWSLSLEKVQELQNEYEDKRDCVVKIKGTDPKDMWLSDIDHLEETLEVCEAEEAKLKAELEEQQGGRDREAAKGESCQGRRLEQAAAAPRDARRWRSPCIVGSRPRQGALRQEEDHSGRLDPRRTSCPPDGECGQVDPRPLGCPGRPPRLQRGSR